MYGLYNEFTRYMDSESQTSRADRQLKQNDFSLIHNPIADPDGDEDQSTEEEYLTDEENVVFQGARSVAYIDDMVMRDRVIGPPPSYEEATRGDAPNPASVPIQSEPVVEAANAPGSSKAEPVLWTK